MIVVDPNNPDRTFIEADVIEVGTIVTPEDPSFEPAVGIVIGVDRDEKLGRATLLYRLRSREDVEEVIRSLRVSAEETWPTN